MQQALCAVSVAAVLCVCAVQWHLAGAPAALTARWTNDYQSLLNREASTLPGVDIARADAPGGIERENDAMLASARKEQDEYMKENDAEALAQAKDTVQMAREINAKFGGSFHNGIGSNTWAGTPVRPAMQTFACVRASCSHISSDAHNPHPAPVVAVCKIRQQGFADRGAQRRERSCGPSADSCPHCCARQSGPQSRSRGREQEGADVGKEGQGRLPRQFAV